VDPFSANSLLNAAGPYAVAAVFLVLLVESAVPIGFVLPGDTLLLTAGLACATGHLSLPWVLAASGAGAMLGAEGGYLLGRLGVRALLPDARAGHARRAVARFEQLSARRGYGPALLAARFIPVARSVAGPLSGMLRVPAARFTAWQAAGGLVWTSASTLAGYGVGRAAPGLERYLPELLLAATLSFPITAGLGYLLVRLRAHRLIARAPLALLPDEKAARS
jgi:membrane-associated protein